MRPSWEEPLRIACVDVPALPLQLYLRDHPEHVGHPVAVVDVDKPQGVLLWTNEKARAFRILPGMRYAAALSLSADLRAGVVETSRTDEGVRHLHARLLRFTPDVEPAKDEPGVFWLNAQGLKELYPSLLEWARAIRAALKEDAFFATVVVGFSRFGSYAVAKSRPGYGVFKSADDERAALQKVPLDRLALEPKLRDALERLAVRSVGDLVKLPLSGLRRRFGAEIHRLARLGLYDLGEPLAPARLCEPVSERLILDFGEASATRLLFLIKGSLGPLLRALSQRNEALAGLKMALTLDKRAGGDEREVLEVEVRPASPTLDSAQVADLVRLKLESLSLEAGVVEILLVADGVAATLEQMRMFAESLLPGARRARDLAAANRALSRVRARYGDEAVVKARLVEGHLPEARFQWERLTHAPLPRGTEAGDPDEGAPDEAPRTLVRRIYASPLPLPPRPRHEPDGWMLRGLEHGPVVKVLGPYVVSGGWWRGYVHREYCFAETQKGEVLWVYYDRRRRRWYLQGVVD